MNPKSQTACIAGAYKHNAQRLAALRQEPVAHTPTPWRVDGSRRTTAQGTENLFISHGNADTVSPQLAEILSDGDRLPASANAAFICKAVNSHADLCDALQIAVTWMETHRRYNAVNDSGPLSQDIASARALLARIGGAK